MNKQHGLLFKMLCICLATVLMAGSMATMSFAHEGDDHTWGTWSVIIDENGTQIHQRSCTGCPAVQEHPIVGGWTTIIKDGKELHTRQCITCGERESHDISWDEWATDAAKDAEGNIIKDAEGNIIIGNTHSRKCAFWDCEVTETHMWGAWATDVAKDAEGNIIEDEEGNPIYLDTHTRECTVDDCELTETHWWDVWEPDVAKDAEGNIITDEKGNPTYLDTHTRKCAVKGCNQEETKAHSIDYDDNGDGTHSPVCVDCGAKFPEKKIKHEYNTWDYDGKMHAKQCECGKYDMTTLEEHTWGAWDYNDGWHWRTCTKCEYYYEGTHTYSPLTNKSTAPTCTEPGTWTQICADKCGFTIVDNNYLPPRGHDYKWEVTKNRTLFTPGVKTWTCWRCNSSTDPAKTEKIPSIVEDIGTWIVGAFGFVGHVAYEPIRWIVKLFHNPVEKDK